MPGPDLSLSIVNPDTGKAVVYQNTPATLRLVLTNLTGGDIALHTGSGASNFEIYLPPFYSSSELGAMGIALPNWSFSVDRVDQLLLLTYSGPAGAVWGDGSPISFSITNAISAAAPSSGTVQVNPGGMSGVPAQVGENLTLDRPPKPGDARLTDVLSPSLDNDGQLYVSVEGDPLSNTLFLNLKNTGRSALYSGSAPWQGNPQVIVSFVYGQTSGSLADNQRAKSSIGSAWNITASIQSSQGNAWQVTNPEQTGQDQDPQWILQPAATNLGILGASSSDSADVTFAFSSIVSLTPIGHTQITLQFTGFSKDEHTLYDDAVFVLDIDKLDPPPTRGLINFEAGHPEATVTDPQQTIQRDLRWTMFQVASVQLLSNVPGVEPVTVTYPNPQPLAYDRLAVTIPYQAIYRAWGFSEQTSVIYTLQSFDGNGNELNTLQFTLSLTVDLLCDPRDGKLYPLVHIHGQTWMAANFDYAAPNSWLYGNNPANEAQYGRLYTLEAALNSPPLGWRLPSNDDWNALFDVYGGQNVSYPALIAGGVSGFNAQLGGWGPNGFGEMGNLGEYWTSSSDTTASCYAATFSPGYAFPEGYNPNPGVVIAYSVRYLKVAIKGLPTERDMLRAQGASPEIEAVAVNPTTQQALIHQNVTAGLALTLTNRTGGTIILKSTGKASRFDIFLPTKFFEPKSKLGDVTAKLDNWRSGRDGEAVTLTYTGTHGAEWKVGQTLTIALANITAAGQPRTDSIQINPENFEGRFPLQSLASLTLALPPKPGNAKLSEVLEVSLDSKTVYISADGDWLVNSLFLNLKLTGKDPLYSGAAVRSWTPNVVVSFACGRGAGSLAPDSPPYDDPMESAWKITAGVKESEGNEWTAGAAAPGADAHPTWSLSPTGANKPILGGERRGNNITFEFKDIVSATPAGHTEMYVFFTGFRKNETIAYDDYLVILDIRKQQIAAERGALGFYSTTPIVTASLPDEELSVTFAWSMFHVAQVKLLSAVGQSLRLAKTYATSPPLQYDRATIKVKYSDLFRDLAVQRSANVLYTLQAFNARGDSLNSPQFTIAFRGDWRALTFVPASATVAHDDPARPVTIKVDWTLFQAQKVVIKGGGSATPLLERPYTNPPMAVVSDSATLSIAVPSPASTVPLSLEAQDGQGALLNNLNSSVTVNDRYFTDPRDGQKYPVVEVFNPRTNRRTLWTTRNAAHQIGKPDHSYPYRNDPANIARYGLMYSILSLQNAGCEPPSPWRCARIEDWRSLIEAFGGEAVAYNALMDGGSSGINLQLGGQSFQKSYSGLGVFGRYWTAWMTTVRFQNGEIKYEGGSPLAASIRYVRDL